MSALRDTALSLAMAALQPGESPASIAVYLDERPMLADEIIETGKAQLAAAQGSYLVFIDLAPPANWGHPCRYLLVSQSLQRGAIAEGSMPPFLRGASKTLTLIWKGGNVPDWTLAVRRAPD
jgi:hypothetical protein